MDNAQHTAFNFYAPEDERIDALAALQKTYQPTSTELLSAEVLAEITALAHNKAPLLKAIDPAVVPFPSANSAQHAAGMQSVYLDEFQLNSQGDYWERPSSLSFDSLRAMAAQTPILNAVIMTRVRQVQRFARLCDTNNTLPGFEIRHIDRKHQLTTDQHEKIIQLQNFISHGGNESSPRARRVLRRDSFAQFMGKATRDSLLLDSVAIETERAKDRSLGLTGLYVVDGATIRLCPESGYRNNKDLFAVQVVNGLVRTAYGYDDLLYEARNPRSDVTTIGYGLPETELLVRVVTGFLNAMTLNNNVFDKNAIPKGILHLSGNYSQEDLSAFKRYWHGMVKGLDSHLTVPVLVSKDQESRAAFEKFGVDFNEMMFAKWMTFLTSIICAIYGMSPSEINFDSFTGGSTSALGGNDTAEKLAASKDSGLRPLLAYFENLLTDYVVGDLESNFCFRWTGLDVEDQDKKYELRKTLLTLNELRAEEGYEKIEGALGEAPVDASLLNAWMQLQAQQQPEDEGETNDGENKQQDDGNDKELSKSFKHHEGRQGQRGGSLSKQTVEIGSGQSVPPSSTIATYQQAHDYYQANLAGKSFLIDVKTKSNLQPIAVFFDRLNSHIYTREAKEGETPDTWDNKKHYRGSRVFDASRAVHMDKILPTLQHPTIILDSNGRDLYIGKKIDMDRFEIVVLTVDSVNKCTLSTAQPRSKEEVKRLRERLRSVKPGQLRKAFEGLAEAQELHLASRTDLLALRASTLGLSNNPPVPTLQVQTEATETIIPYPHFVKSEPLHDEHGRFSASDSNSEIGSIDTLQAAEHYYQDHLAGVWRLTIQRKAGNFDVNVNFNENQDHAYTKTNKETGLREFDLVRAKFMPQMLGTITEPEVILQNGNRDLFIEKQLDNIHYAVVLEWKDSAKEYRFRSAHCWNKAEYDNHLKKYNRPASHGKKTTQKKAPERLSKSSGAYSTFTHLRDSTALLQSPPKHNCKSGASLVNPIGLGGELVETSSCYPTVSIDGLPTFVKSIDWHSVSLEPLHKAQTNDTQHDIFEPHENPFIRGLVEDYYESGMIRLSAVRIALNQWLAGQRYQPDKALLSLPEALLYTSTWQETEAGQVTDYLAGIAPEAFTVKDLSLLSKLLIRHYLPTDVLIDASLLHSAQSFMMGAVQAHWQAKPETSISLAQVAALRDTLPTTLEAVVNALRLAPVAKASLDYGAVRAAENIVALSSQARASLQNVLMAQALKKLSGDHTATPQQLEQQLGDAFAELNRDWRRIALTETGEMSLQGFVAAQAFGTRLKRLEQYRGACGFCKKIDGTVMEVVDPEQQDKDGRTQIWVGKTNIGRSSSARKRTEDGLVPRDEQELWWLAAGVMHPHCRGLWVRVT